MVNAEIKQTIKRNRLFQYEVAAEIGISEYTLCVWLRRELTQERKQLVLDAVQRLTKGGGTE